VGAWKTTAKVWIFKPYQNSLLAWPQNHQGKVGSGAIWSKELIGLGSAQDKVAQRPSA
jgi:hypothetical protein